MRRWRAVLSLVVASGVLAACGSPRVKSETREPQPSASRGVEPRVEPLRPANARPYTVLGRTYFPMSDFAPYWEEGVASWYGRDFHGKPTASGESYNMFAMTAAHKTLPIPSYARVTNLANGRQVVVRVNDRGPFVDGRLIDLSFAAAQELGFANQGTTPVRVELILPEEIRAAERERRSFVAQAAPSALPDAERLGSAQGGEPMVTQVASAQQSERLAPAVAEPASPLAANAPSALPRSAFYLQLGAFAQPDNAESFVAHLRSQFPEMPLRIHVQGALARVVAGPYRDATVAQLAAEQLNAQFGRMPLVVSGSRLGLMP